MKVKFAESARSAGPPQQMRAISSWQPGVWWGGDAGGRRPPTLFDRGKRVPDSPHFFGLKFVQKLVHTEIHCGNFSDVYECTRMKA